MQGERKGGNCTPQSLKNTEAKVLNEILANEVQQYVNRIIKQDLFQGCEATLAFRT